MAWVWIGIFLSCSGYEGQIWFCGISPHKVRLFLFCSCQWGPTCSICYVFQVRSDVFFMYADWVCCATLELFLFGLYHKVFGGSSVFVYHFPICSGYHSVVLFSLMVKTLHKVKYSWECSVPPDFHWNQQMCRVRVSGALYAQGIVNCG